MFQLLPVVIDHLGGCCPVQGEGTIDGHRFYLRLRGSATLSIADGHDDPVSVGWAPGDLTAGWHMDLGTLAETLVARYPVDADTTYFGYWTPEQAANLLGLAVDLWRANPDLYRVTR